MQFYVYAHLNPVTLTPFYIGKGVGNRIDDIKGRNKFWQNTVDKYGYNTIKLAEGLTEVESFEIEKQYIERYGLRINGGTLTNLTYGGSGGNTINDTNRTEWLIKCRNVKLGERNPNFGKPGWMTGIKLSDAHKEILRQHRLGKKLSPEVKVKVLAGLAKAAKKSLESRTHKVQCLVTKKIWPGRKECIEELNINIDSFKQRILRNKPIKGNHLQLIKR